MVYVLCPQRPRVPYGVGHLREPETVGPGALAPCPRHSHSGTGPGHPALEIFAQEVGFHAGRSSFKAGR